MRKLEPTHPLSILREICSKGTPIIEQLRWETLFICAWCMPAGIPGSHGCCKRCSVKVYAEIAAMKGS